MKSSPIVAFSVTALFEKSKVYIARGIKAKNQNSFDEYQLWASLAIELLAKSSLSSIHPSLVADPTHYQSLFAACGREISPDVKTITAKTLFERLSHISKDFDNRLKTFCIEMAIRRNSEIHSGESPFTGAIMKLWEAKFWYAAYIVLQIQEKDLEDWLSSEAVGSSRATLNDANQAINMMVSRRIELALEDFKKNHKNEKKRKQLIEQSEHINPWEHWKKFNYSYDSLVIKKCPACEGFGVLAGSKFEEYYSEDEHPNDTYEEYIDVDYSSEEYICTVCDLRLNGVQEISATSLPNEYTETVVREIEFEPDYGND